jgi:hypothetical protein
MSYLANVGPNLNILIENSGVILYASICGYF